MLGYITLVYLTDDKFLYTTSPTLPGSFEIPRWAYVENKTKQKKNSEALPPIGTKVALQTVKNTAELLVSISNISQNDYILS